MVVIKENFRSASQKRNVLTWIHAGNVLGVGRLHVPVGLRGADLRGQQQPTHVANALRVLQKRAVLHSLAAPENVRLQRKTTEIRKYTIGNMYSASVLIWSYIAKEDPMNRTQNWSSKLIRTIINANENSTM